jgi:cardiolipin synthase
MILAPLLNPKFADQPGSATYGELRVRGATAVVRRGAWQGRLAGLSASSELVAGAGRLSIPNLITLARILLVPVVVWAIASNQMLFAFLLFAAAGVSDAVDGFLAKRFGMASELGAYLDPLADKVLIVSIYVSLGVADALPRWLVILVVSRDLLIVGGVLFSWLLNKPVGVKPHMVSKVNTAAQLLLVGLVLAALGFGFDAGWALTLTMIAVAALTLASVAVYLREWVRHMGANGISH